MTSIIDAIKALDANAQVVVNGEPSNQAEYESQVKYISGADENGSAIYKDTQDFTWEQVSAKKAELQTMRGMPLVNSDKYAELQKLTGWKDISPMEFYLTSLQFDPNFKWEEANKCPLCMCELYDVPEESKDLMGDITKLQQKWQEQVQNGN